MIHRRNRAQSIEQSALLIYKEILKFLQSQNSVPLYEIRELIKKSQEKNKEQLGKALEKIRVEDEQVTQIAIQQETHYVLVNN